MRWNWPFQVIQLPADPHELIINRSQRCPGERPTNVFQVLSVVVGEVLDPAVRFVDRILGVRHPTLPPIWMNRAEIGIVPRHFATDRQLQPAATHVLKLPQSGLAGIRQSPFFVNVQKLLKLHRRHLNAPKAILASNAEV